MKIASTTRFAIPCLAMLIGVVAGFGWRSLVDRTDGHLRIDPGTELFSVLPDDMMSLTYTTAALMLTAQRSRPGAAAMRRARIRRRLQRWPAAAIWWPGADRARRGSRRGPNSGPGRTEPAPGGPAGRAPGSIPYNRSFKKPAVARPAWGAGV
ncbi:hypothetical protein [Burkholderia ambifaria]|uniref:hypothetical protein n=1 Tax=Burkholderia ambifaria TaxID=152480 RepID=UPI00158C2530|nr:hypothetical protein [Burkholderia ambifaria]WDS01455.1 hypothetical protein OR985_27745 [Burkholderia ambifaria]